MHWRSKRERPASVAGVRGTKPCVVLCDDFWLLLGSGPNWAASAVVAHLMITLAYDSLKHNTALRKLSRPSCCTVDAVQMNTHCNPVLIYMLHRTDMFDRRDESGASYGVLYEDTTVMKVARH